MNFPKQIMRKAELIKMGFPKEMLNRIYDIPGQTVAWKADPTLINSPILYDTEKLSIFIADEIKMTQAVRRRG